MGPDSDPCFRILIQNALDSGSEALIVILFCLQTVINELPLTTQTLAATVCKTMTGKNKKRDIFCLNITGFTSIYFLLID